MGGCLAPCLDVGAGSNLAAHQGIGNSPGTPMHGEIGDWNGNMSHRPHSSFRKENPGKQQGLLPPEGQPVDEVQRQQDFFLLGAQDQRDFLRPEVRRKESEQFAHHVVPDALHSQLPDRLVSHVSHEPQVRAWFHQMSYKPQLSETTHRDTADSLEYLLVVSNRCLRRWECKRARECIVDLMNVVWADAVEKVAYCGEKRPEKGIHVHLSKWANVTVEEEGSVTSKSYDAVIFGEDVDVDARSWKCSAACCVMSGHNQAKKGRPIYWDGRPCRYFLHDSEYTFSADLDSFHGDPMGYRHGRDIGLSACGRGH